MKRLKVLTALAMGIMASASGMIQAQAVIYEFGVDFNTKEVDDYTDFKQTFTTDTYNLEGRLNFYWEGFYKFDLCPTAFSINALWTVSVRYNNTGTTFLLASEELPNLNCTTTYTRYEAEASIILPLEVVESIMDDDADYVRFISTITFRYTAGSSGRTMSLLDFQNYFNISYDFNTTYLFNYFLSDQQFVTRTTTAGTGGSWTLNSLQRVFLEYLYTTAGDDEYRITNNNVTDIGASRKKYAVDYQEQFFRGESVGAQFQTYHIDDPDNWLIGTTTGTMNWNYNYYFLNTANLAQAIVDAPIFEFEEEDCGSFLALNVGCFINNAFAYITNDAPIVSDAFTLLNAGIEMAAQTFGIIGEFADDNVFGVLILAGFGFIAVKWFLKND